MRLKSYDFLNAFGNVSSLDASKARRQFKKRFGMTFVEYARAGRMSLAMKQIRAGEAVMDVKTGIGAINEVLKSGL